MDGMRLEVGRFDIDIADDAVLVDDDGRAVVDTDGFDEDTVIAPGLVAGDYAIAWRTTATAVPEIPQQGHGWRYYPDPATDAIMLLAPAGEDLRGAHLLIHDLQGRALGKWRLHQSPDRVGPPHVAPQTVLLSLQHANRATLPLGP